MTIVSKYKVMQAMVCVCVCVKSCLFMDALGHFYSLSVNTESKYLASDA